MPIRSYGPGKFDNIIDSYVYALSGEGWTTEEVGDVGDFGWYGWFELGPEALKRTEEIAADERDRLDPEERELIRESYGVILSEDEQGFVSVDYFDTEKELKRRWAKIEAEAEEFYEEAEEES